MKSLTALALLLFLSGCSSLSAEWMHVSHPLLGPPFGPKTEEDSLNVLNACAEKHKGVMYVESCLGYQMADGGFYGDDFIYTMRVGVRKEFKRD